MEEELISFKTAKLAKEKGFNEPVYSIYSGGILFKYLEGDNPIQTWNHCKDMTCSAPTQSLLQRWLREEHKIHIEIKPVPFGHDCFKWIYKIGLMEIINLENLSRKNYYSILAKQNEKYFDTYEESLEAGLFEALSLI